MWKINNKNRKWNCISTFSHTTTFCVLFLPYMFRLLMIYAACYCGLFLFYFFYRRKFQTLFILVFQMRNVFLICLKTNDWDIFGNLHQIFIDVEDKCSQVERWNLLYMVVVSLLCCVLCSMLIIRQCNVTTNKIWVI